MSGVADVRRFAEGAVGEFTALHASRCADCGRVEFPRRTECPACGASAAPIELDGPATVRVLTGVLAQPPGALIQAPYDIAVAEFAEGICVIGLVDGEATRGDRVRPVILEPFDDGRAFAFRRTSTHDEPTGADAR
jgi:uncharacterized OB-fold protein